MKRSSTYFVLVVLLVMRAAALGQTPTNSRPVADPALERLQREITRLAQVAGGVVGVSALHLESDRRVAVNGGEPFPMASSYKVPIAARLLHQIDQGEMSLDRMVQLQLNQLSPGSGTLSDLFNKPGVILSVRNLLELMLLISDNTATDTLLRLAGGGAAVTARMRELGIDGIRVDRPTKQLIAEWLGVAGQTDSQWTLEQFREQTSGVKPDERQAAAKRFDADLRDTATPDAMATLLERIYRQQALKRENTELLLDIMRRCRTGDARLKGLLPAGTEVAHKTGTIGGTTNDVGIITLPDGAGHVAIAVFVKASAKDVSARERAIAEIARAVHDFFLFNPR